MKFLLKFLKQNIKFTNYLNTAITLCIKCINEIKKTEYKSDNKLKNPRHYQMISDSEKYKNFYKDKKYILSYFQDYLKWLRIIEFYFFKN